MEQTHTLRFTMERLRLGHWRSSQAFILITICTAIFVDAFIYGLVVPVIPFVLRNESRTDEQQLQVSTSLIIAGFGVMDFIGAPLTAWYIDRTTSRRVPFLFGLAMMVIGTILFGIPSATWSLFVSRVLRLWVRHLIHCWSCSPGRHREA